jgi:hypothetical protein
LHAEAERDGLTKDAIRTAAELRLRRHRLPLTDRDGTPALYVAVDSVKHPYGHAYSLTVKFRQLASLVLRSSDSRPLSAVTWEAGFVGTIGAEELRNLIEDVERLIDEFSNDYLAVNPLP